MARTENERAVAEGGDSHVGHADQHLGFRFHLQTVNTQKDSNPRMAHVDLYCEKITLVAVIYKTLSHGRPCSSS